MDEQTTKVIIAIIAVITVIVSGSLIAIKKSKTRNTKSNQECININGNGNKIVGGDDNSTR